MIFHSLRKSIVLNAPNSLMLIVDAALVHMNVAVAFLQISRIKAKNRRIRQSGVEIGSKELI
jgi:hypothetical protein